MMENIPILACKDLSKTYSFPVFSHFNLTLPLGKIIGLLGPNGSGKTTLIKMAAGLLTPTSGEILVGGVAPGALTKGIVSYLPERNALPEWMNATELVSFFGTMFPDFDPSRADKMLFDLGINMHQRIRQLSKGTKEKVQLVLTMSRQAKLYLLDEPIGGVDPATRDYILNTIIQNYAKDSTVLISTHLIADVEPVLDDFLFLNKGVVVRSGSVQAFREVEGISLDEAFRRDFRC